MYYNAEILRGLMNEQPFRPFRVFLASGRYYDVPHHGAAFVTEYKLEVGLDLNKKGIARQSVNCPLAN